MLKQPGQLPTFETRELCMSSRLAAVQKAFTQRAQYPLIKEYGLNYIGLHIMI